MPLPDTCLIENIPAVMDPGVGALRLSDLRDPMNAGRLIRISATYANRAASGTYPGRTVVNSYIDEVDPVTYPNAGPGSFYSVAPSNGIEADDTVGTTAPGRGIRLPVAAVQGKSAITIALIVKYDAAYNGTGAETLLGSCVDGSTTPMLHIGRASGTGALQVSARRNATTDTSSTVALGQPPSDEFIAMLTTINYQDGWIDFDVIRSNPEFDQASGRVPAFVGNTGTSATLANQGFILGSRGGATDAGTWDAFKFRGTFRKLYVSSGYPSRTPYTNATLSPRDLLIDLLRAEINLMNA